MSECPVCGEPAEFSRTLDGSTSLVVPLGYVCVDDSTLYVHPDDDVVERWRGERA